MAQINGPGSAQGKGWAGLGPEYFYSLFGWGRARPANWAEL